MFDHGPRDDGRAVSPVIGVILMVAITVILAAVVAAFVTGIGPDLADRQPTATFGFDYDDGTDTVEVAVQNTGATSVRAGTLAVTGDLGTDASADVYEDEPDLGGGTPFGDASQLAAGDRFTVSVTGPAYEIRVVWNGDGGSATLQTDTGPDA